MIQNVLYLHAGSTQYFSADKLALVAASVLLAVLIYVFTGSLLEDDFFGSHFFPY